MQRGWLVQAGREQGLASRTIFLGGKTFLASMAKLLSAKNARVAMAATRALGAAGPDAAAYFPLLARELSRRRSTHVQRTFDDGHNPQIPWALASIDEKRAIPLLKEACKKGHRPAALFLIDNRPEAFRELLAFAGADKVVEELFTPLGPGRDSRPFLEVANKNGQLSARVRELVAKQLAESPSETWASSPGAALAEVDRLLADAELNLKNDYLVDPFAVVARGAKASVPLVARLRAMQKGSPVVAARATWVLGEIPDPAARASLQAALDPRNDWRSILLAANALARQGNAAVATAGALRRLAAEHWHPAVRAEALVAANAVEGKAPAPAPLVDVTHPDEFSGYGSHWGQSGESLGKSFACQAPKSWGKAAVSGPCQIPAELGKTADCTLVHRMDSGWLRVAPGSQVTDGKWEEFPEAKFEYLPPRVESRDAIVALKAGYVRGVTGAGNRACAVESERTDKLDRSVDGPGRTWLSTFEKKGTTWSQLP